MRLITILIVAMAVVSGLTQWSKSRDPLSGATQSAQGFVEVPMPDGANPLTVLIFTPVNCPSDWAQRATALLDDLQREGIPAQLSSSYSVRMIDPTPEQKQALKRFGALNKKDGPIVLVNGRAKANPRAYEVIAEYRGS